MDLHPSELPPRTVGRARTAAGLGCGVGAATGDLPAGTGGRGYRVAGESQRQGQSRRHTSVRLLPRRRDVPVGKFDVETRRWTDVDAGGSVDRDELTLSTYNIWNDDSHAEQRYLAIAELLS